MKTIRVFEAFAGYGSQLMALPFRPEPKELSLFEL